MAYEVSKVDVWAADIPNRPGTLSNVLATLSDAGAELEFMIARRATDQTSRIFVAPLKGAKQQNAATAAGLKKAVGMHSLRVEGPNRAGLGAKITGAVAEQGINLRGASAAAIGKKAVFYLAVEGEDNRKKAINIVRDLLNR